MTTKSSGAIMRLDRLARTSVGQFGREYLIPPGPSTVLIWLDSGSSVGSINAVLSVDDVITTIRQEVRAVINRIRTVV